MSFRLGDQEESLKLLLQRAVASIHGRDGCLLRCEFSVPPAPPPIARLAPRPGIRSCWRLALSWVQTHHGVQFIASDLYEDEVQVFGRAEHSQNLVAAQARGQRPTPWRAPHAAGSTGPPMPEHAAPALAPVLLAPQKKIWGGPPPAGRGILALGVSSDKMRVREGWASAAPAATVAVPAWPTLLLSATPDAGHAGGGAHVPPCQRVPAHHGPRRRVQARVLPAPGLRAAAGQVGGQVSGGAARLAARCWRCRQPHPLAPTVL